MYRAASVRESVVSSSLPPRRVRQPHSPENRGQPRIAPHAIKHRRGHQKGKRAIAIPIRGFKLLETAIFLAQSKRDFCERERRDVGVLRGLLELLSDCPGPLGVSKQGEQRGY